MSSRRPETFDQVEALLKEAEQELHPAHRTRFQKMRVPFYEVPVSGDPGGSVVVVAECEGKVVYWSDIEEGWELDTLENGSIRERGCNQYELVQLMWQLFGDPETMPGRW
jgi:hypothetical protein